MADNLTAGATPVTVCGPTCGCGKTTPFSLHAFGWMCPAVCMHCGKSFGSPFSIVDRDSASPAPLQEATSPSGEDSANAPSVDTPLLAAKRRAFDSPTQANLDALIQEAVRAASPLSESPTADAQALYERLLAEKLRWFEEAAAGDRARHSATDSATLADCLDEIRHFAPAAMHWSLNLASERLRAAHPDTQRLDWLETTRGVDLRHFNDGWLIEAWAKPSDFPYGGTPREAIDAARALRSAPDTPERP